MDKEFSERLDRVAERLSSASRRLKEAIKIIDERADAQIDLAEDQRLTTVVNYTALGFITGARFARDVILDQFPDIFSDGEGD